MSCEPEHGSDVTVGGSGAGTSQRSVGAFVARHGVRRPVASGEIVFLEGDRSEHVYVAVSGRVKVVVTTPSGREVVLGLKEPGEVFGELSAIDEGPRSASCVAVEPGELAVLRGRDFLAGLRSQPELSVQVLQDLADRMRRTNARLVARTTSSTRARAGAQLLELAALVRGHGVRAARVELSITQGDLADWIGATRESTARALAEYRRDGVVSTGRGRIVVHDLAALETAVLAA